jgi:HAMP domain-containing protein
MKGCASNMAARLPTRDGDDAATEATINLNCVASQMEKMASELTRLSNELREGIFGGRAEFVVSMRKGPWRDSIEAFNAMEWSITEQVRDIAKAARRLAAGRTDYFVTAKCQGETLDLKHSMNAIVEKMKAGNKTVVAER